METRGAIRVLVNIDHQLHRELLKRIIRQQTDMEIVEFVPDGTEPHAWTAIGKECEGCHVDERVVVILSFQADKESSFRELCGGWLMHFPGLIVVAIDWAQPKVITLRYELRCDEVANSLQGLINAIRYASSCETTAPGAESRQT